MLHRIMTILSLLFLLCACASEADTTFDPSRDPINEPVSEAGDNENLAFTDSVGDDARKQASVNKEVVSRAPLTLANISQSNKVAAVVNGQPITVYDLQKEAIPDLVRARIAPNDPGKVKETDAILRRALDNMIMDILVTQEAARLKVQATKGEVDEEITKFMQAQRVNKKQFEERLAQQKMTVDSFRKQVEKKILSQKLMSMEVGRKVVVTPQEINEYYEAHKNELFNRDGLHMGLLVYHPKAPAATIASQIKSGKITFEEAAAKYSIAPNRDKGGDTGPVEWDRLNPEWAGKLNNMRPGDVTDLFPLQNFKAQIHLFRPGGGEEKQLTLEEAKRQIDSILRMPKARERFGDYTKQLRNKAVIDVRI